MEKLREEKGMPPVSYEETYKWYDRKLKEYMEGQSEQVLWAGAMVDI